MANIILIYTTDPWHNFASRELIAVATTEKQRDKLVKKYLRDNLAYGKPDKALRDKALKEIQDMGQTQCLTESCDLEIDTEAYDTNVIL